MSGSDALERIAHAGDLVASPRSGFYSVGIFFCGGAADEKRRLDVELVEHLEDVPDAGARAILHSAADHGVWPIAGQQRHAFAGLVLEGKRDRQPNAVRPACVRNGSDFFRHECQSMGLKPVLSPLTLASALSAAGTWLRAA